MNDAGVPAPRFPWRTYWLVLAAIVVIAVAPLVPVYLAGEVASANGCVLSERTVTECRVDGADQGPLLHVLGTMGWLFLVTMPLGGIAFLGWIGILIPHRLRWGSTQRLIGRR